MYIGDINIAPLVLLTSGLHKGFFFPVDQAIPERGRQGTLVTRKMHMI